MPRPRQTERQSLSPGQAAYVIERLISERRISPNEVNRYVSDMSREIDELEQRLERLREAHGGGLRTAPAGAAATRRRGPGRPPGRGSGRAAASRGTQDSTKAGAGKQRTRRRSRKRSPVTSEQLASRQLQGRYLALVRQFGENKRAHFAKIAKEQGREAAIREMQDSIKK